MCRSRERRLPGNTDIASVMHPRWSMPHFAPLIDRSRVLPEDSTVSDSSQSEIIFADFRFGGAAVYSSRRGGRGFAKHCQHREHGCRSDVRGAHVAPTLRRRGRVRETNAPMRGTVDRAERLSRDRRAYNGAAVHEELRRHRALRLQDRSRDRPRRRGASLPIRPALAVGEAIPRAIEGGATIASLHARRSAGGRGLMSSGRAGHTQQYYGIG